MLSPLPFDLGSTPITASPIPKGYGLQDYATFPPTISLEGDGDGDSPVRPTLGQSMLNSCAQLPAVLVSVLLILLNAIAFGLLMVAKCLFTSPNLLLFV
jgi:hypothetical protein